MQLYRREWRLGVFLTVSLLLAALLTDSLVLRIAFVILVVGSGVLTALALQEDRRSRK